MGTNYSVLISFTKGITSYLDCRNMKYILAGLILYITFFPTPAKGLKVKHYLIETDENHKHRIDVREREEKIKKRGKETKKEKRLEKEIKKRQKESKKEKRYREKNKKGQKRDKRIKNDRLTVDGEEKTKKEYEFKCKDDVRNNCNKDGVCHITCGDGRKFDMSCPNNMSIESIEEDDGLVRIICGKSGTFSLKDGSNEEDTISIGEIKMN